MKEDPDKTAVLVVDDTPENIDVLNGILTDDYQVKVAIDGRKALKIALSPDPPGLILLDIMMPGMDGYQVCRELKTSAATRDIPVIFVTAKGEVVDEARGFEAGAVDYITKPVSPSLVRARVKTHLELRESCRKLEQLVSRVEQALKEKEILLKEVQHRSKNNLQIISSVINLQSKKIPDGPCKDSFGETGNMIQSMALLHNKLLQSGNLTQVDSKDYISSLVKELIVSYQPLREKVSVHIDADEVAISVDAWLYLGLILNELLTNALKHAFPGSREGRVDIVLRSRVPDGAELTVRDNGIGFPEDLDWRQARSLGLKLVKAFLRSPLKGEMEIRRDRGTEIKINLPAG